jgi:ribonuclease VapC
MIVDTSALVAILTGEPEAEEFEALIESNIECSMSLVSVFESSIVLDARMGDQGVRELDWVLSRLEIRLIPVDPEQLEWARHGYRVFGKGKHAAGLNFGDCFSYALAKSRNEPLLFKGNDFRKTDVAIAL